MDTFKEMQLEARFARLERELAELDGRSAMAVLALRAVIATHPDAEAYKQALRPFLGELHFPNQSVRQGFDGALQQFEQALAGCPTPPTNPT